MLLKYILFIILFYGLLVSSTDEDIKRAKKETACQINVLSLESVDQNGYHVSCVGESYYSFVCIDKNRNSEGCIHMRRDGKNRLITSDGILYNVLIGSYYDRDTCIDKTKDLERKGFVCEWINGEMNCHVCVNGDKEWYNFNWIKEN